MAPGSGCDDSKNLDMLTDEPLELAVALRKLAEGRHDCRGMRWIPSGLKFSQAMSKSLCAILQALNQPSRQRTDDEKRVEGLERFNQNGGGAPCQADVLELFLSGAATAIGPISPHNSLPGGAGRVSQPADLSPWSSRLWDFRLIPAKGFPASNLVVPIRDFLRFHRMRASGRWDADHSLE